MELLTSSKDTLLTLPELINLPAPQVLTQRHRPVLHGELATMAIKQAKDMGLVVNNQQHAISKNGEKYFGLLEVSDPLNINKGSGTLIQGKDGQRTIIGLRNSHDMTLGAGMVCGLKVLVCSNLDFWGEVRISIRHIGDVRSRLLDSIQSSLPKVIDMEKMQDDRIAHYRRIPVLKEQDIYPTLIKAMDLKVIPSSHIGKVLGEFREPSFDEFRGQHNVYRLWNAFTTVMRPQSMGRLWNLPERGAGLHRVLDAGNWNQGS